MSIDEKFMQRALMLAVKGGRQVAPNPMVGAVIVKNGKIIGEGWHKKFGGPHAEINAIRSARKSSDLVGATLYVTLEPCRHTGKTPPCVNAILDAGIVSVIYGAKDPFIFKSQIRNSKPQTNFKSKILNSKFLQQKCQALNKFFFTWVTKKRPYITAKIAVSADGFVAGQGGRTARITSATQDRFVHKLRAEHQVIMVGIGTVLADNPQLNVRLVKGVDPLRVILDSHLKIPRGARVLKNKNYLIATTQKNPPKTLNTWISSGKQVSLTRLFKYLASIGISSVLVEPGPTFYASLKKQKLIDELIVLTGKKELKRGLRFNQ